MRFLSVFLFMLAFAVANSALAQQEAPPDAPPARVYKIETGTHVPLSMINSVSTRNSAPGDRVYLETVFPILSGGRIVIPPGSYVMGTITEIRRPGKLKGRGEFHLRFDSLTLPNGATRDFRAQVTNLDGRANEQLDRKEGTIRSEGNKAGDARTVAETTVTGASIGALAGISKGATGMGSAIGAGAGAAVGLAAVLLSRGPDAVLAKGTTVEMVLDRELDYAEGELDFNGAPRRAGTDGPGPLPSKRTASPGRTRFPIP